MRVPVLLVRIKPWVTAMRYNYMCRARRWKVFASSVRCRFSMSDRLLWVAVVAEMGCDGCVFRRRFVLRLSRFRVGHPRCLYAVSGSSGESHQEDERYDEIEAAASGDASHIGLPSLSLSWRLCAAVSVGRRRRNLPATFSSRLHPKLNTDSTLCQRARYKKFSHGIVVFMSDLG